MPVHLINPYLHQALLFAEGGAAVLPFFEPTSQGCSCGAPDCSRIGKHPRTANGVHDATTNAQIITGHWTRWPEANIGIATGSPSGRFVLDVDGSKGRATLAALGGDQPPAPDTSKVLTGRGEHYYFRTGNLRVRTQRLGAGLDLQGEGAYVVAPGSRHASGKPYRPAEWGRRRPPRLLLAAPPGWLRALIAPEPPQADVTAHLEAAPNHAYAHAALGDELDRLRRATEGDRNISLNLCASKGALDRMLEVAKHRLMKADHLFDSEPLLLNVGNGTLDLKTGTLRPHDPADLITKIVPVSYEPQATCPNFARFLDRALKSDAELLSYVQKAVGYSLTGETSEQVFFFAFGPGHTGKSTFVNVVRDLLGDYGLHTPTETIMAKQHDNGIPADLARLEGARMVTAVEVNWTRQVDEARVKSLTGGDPITARHLYHDFFQFQPACKLWLVANDLPAVRGTAEAFWRRVHLIPFEVVIPEGERDEKLVEKLKAEGPGILAWAVRGCLAWQQDGLNPPEAVLRGTADWRRKADHLTRFCNEALIRDGENFVASADLYHHYQGWCEKHGETPLDTRKLKAALEGQDLTHKRINTGSVWMGVKLRLHG